ncbi:MAG: choice-of-anchor J domain-containing protein [Bacteroidaceae bacterium]|nr:choice-of-anchor J domain-containing protein [Bacteroidaceae bacterium]
MKFLNRICLLFAALSVFTACERDYDGPPIEEPTYAVDADANLLTIADIRTLGAAVTSSSVYTFTGDNDVLRAVITGTDITGNIYKKIYVQDETGNIEIEIDQSGIYKDFSEGQEIFLELKGLCISMYGGELQIGDPNGTSNRIAYEDFKARAHKNGWAKASNITVKNINDFSTIQESDRFALVTVENVKFEAGGINTFSEPDKPTNVNLIDSKGNALILRNSNYADFAKKLLPTGTGSITGILGRFNGTWQLTIRSLDDLVGFDPIVDPEDNNGGEQGGGGSGQSGVIYSETFETSQGDFTVEDVTKPTEIANIWKHDAQYKCMKATAYVASSQTRYASESMAVSPLIDLTGVSSATLKFEHCGRYFDGNISQMCTVWIKEEGGSWVQLTGLQYNDETKFTFTANTVDITSYCGKKIQIGFKYTSTSTTAGTYEVRNVSVE